MGITLVFNKLSDEQKEKLMHVGKSYFDYQENALIPQLGFLYSKLTRLPAKLKS